MVKKAAVERYLASEAGQRAIKSQLVADVAENYYLLLALDYKLFGYATIHLATEGCSENRSYSERS